MQSGTLASVALKETLTWGIPELGFTFGLVREGSVKDMGFRYSGILLRFGWAFLRARLPSRRNDHSPVEHSITDVLRHRMLHKNKPKTLQYVLQER